MPARLLPEPVRPWLEDAAERTSLPLEYVAVPTIVCAGATVGRTVGMRPKRFDDWTVVANVWGAIVGPPGWMKSPALAEATRPLRRLAAAAAAKYEEAEKVAVVEREVIELKIAAFKKEAAKKADPDKQNPEGKNDFEAETARDSLSKLLEAKKNAVAVERRYLTQDATTEKLGEILRHNPRGILVVRDEVAGWLATLDRPGREGDREFFLEAWNGTGAYTVDRIGRGTLHVPALTLSVLGGIQPGKLEAYTAAMLRHGGGDDGLLQRFQLLAWPDEIPEWNNVDRSPNRSARDRVFEIFERLDELNPDHLGAEPDGDGIPFVRFTPDAQELFDHWRNLLEQRLRSGALHGWPSFAAHLAKFRSLMPSLALLFELLDRAGRSAGFAGAVSVSLGSACRAAEWTEFFEAHARKLYAPEMRGNIAAAHRLAAKIKSGAVRDGMTTREIAERDWSGLARPGAVHEALEVLEEYGWLRVYSIYTGGRPSEVVRLHPGLRERPDA